MRYSVEHETYLDFPAPVSEHQCELRLTPRRNAFQKSTSVRVTTIPESEIFEYTDAFGNRVHYFTILDPHIRLVTRVEMEIETRLENPFNYALLSPEMEQEWYADTLRVQPSLLQYVLHRSAQTPELSSLGVSGVTVPAWDQNRSVQNSLMRAMDWVASFLTYRSGATLTHASLVDVVKQRSGVCQDFAHLLISLVRSWGLPARYVAGYLDPRYSDLAPTESQPGHAWAEVLIPGAGWRGLDPTHQLMANDTYIAISIGRDSLDAAPQRGSFKGPNPGRAPDVRLVVAHHNQ